MKLKITGLGAIKEARVDLDRKLTVFCGPNNTGKTYLSYVIYALTNTGILQPLPLPDSLMEELVSNKSVSIDCDADFLWTYRQNKLSSIKRNLSTLFGISSDKALSLFKDFKIEFETTEEDFKQKFLREDFSMKINVGKTTFLFTKQSGSSTIKIENQSPLDTFDKDLKETLAYKLLPLVYHCLAVYPCTDSIIFPVERNSIYTFNKELSIRRNYLIDNLQQLTPSSPVSSFEMINQLSTKYPLAIRDGLDIASNMSYLKNLKSPYFSFAEEMENSLLDGQVNLTKEGDVVFTPNTAKTGRLPIHLTASIVKTLASLTFYLKHFAKPNDLVIIDEPELNLHPDSQIILARIFARMLNAGLRLLISTHSDYIIRELNNLVMLSELPETAAFENGYKKEERISKDDISAYLFKHGRGKKITVEPLEVTKTGFDVETIDNAIGELNRVSEELYYKLNYED